MKKMTVLALGLVLSAARIAVAATPVDRIAFDYCHVAEPNPDMCEIRIERPDGTGSLIVAYGVEPAWSPDGAKIAFRTFPDGLGIFVVDLADWSVITIAWPVYGSSPAWSPDGTKIAYFAWEGVYVANVDGSGTVLLFMSNLQGSLYGRVGWSPDGGRLAFDCSVDASNADICSIGADGTGFVRLTDDPAMDFHPAFSPDGETIAFSTERYGYPAIATMTSAGGDVTPVGIESGFWPAWTPDGSRLVYAVPGYSCEPGPGCYPEYDSLRIVNADGSGSELFREVGSHPAWTGWTQPLHPIASFQYWWCDLDCQFNGTFSVDHDGTIVDYAWDFGDGTTGSGATAGHTYSAAGTYTVTLVVTDDDGLTGTQVMLVTIHPPPPPPPMPPVAVLAVNCAQLVCTFNGSTSWDPDGTIVAHAWNFGDGATASGATVMHTYAASGTYTVILTVTDSQGLTDTETTALTATTTQSHVGDLDGTVTQGQGTWTATVTATVHDTIEASLANAVLTAYWSVGGTSSSCTTNAAGQCTVARSFPNSTKQVTLSIGSVTHSTRTYVPAQNHDPDGDSTGTSILVRRH